MKFAITSKGDAKSNTLMQRMRTYLQDFHLEYDEDQPDIVISVGGDGTLLYAFHRYSNRLDKTAFVGVHTGHLGFYADWTPDEIEKLVIALAKTPFQVVEYPLLETIVRYQHGGRETRFLALNESTVKSVEGERLSWMLRYAASILRRSAEMVYALRRHLEVRLIIRRLVEPSSIHQSMPFRLPNWHPLITGCLGRSDLLCCCRHIIHVCSGRSMLSIFKLRSII